MDNSADRPKCSGACATLPRRKRLHVFDIDQWIQAGPSLSTWRAIKFHAAAREISARRTAGRDVENAKGSYVPRVKKPEYRIDAIVESEEDRDRIYAAADAAQQSARVFIGKAALQAASPESMQIARMEHITEAQERLTAELETLKRQLQELNTTLTTVVTTSAKSVAQHTETHRQLDLAMADRDDLRRQFAGLHDRMVSPDDMDAVRKSFQYIIRIVNHLGINLDQE